MRTATKITGAVCVVAIAGLIALAAPALASGVGAVAAWARPHERSSESREVEVSKPAPNPGSPTPTAASGPTSTCVATAGVYWRDDSSAAAEFSPTAVQVAIGTPTDRGKRTGAMGAVRVDAHGDVVGYTVAAGDAPMAIGARFCMDWVSILHFNGYWVTGDGKDIAPGDYLYLVPDTRLVHPYEHPSHKAPAG